MCKKRNTLYYVRSKHTYLKIFEHFREPCKKTSKRLISRPTILLVDKKGIRRFTSSANLAGNFFAILNRGHSNGSLPPRQKIRGIVSVTLPHFVLVILNASTIFSGSIRPIRTIIQQSAFPRAAGHFNRARLCNREATDGRINLFSM